MEGGWYIKMRRRGHQFHLLVSIVNTGTVLLGHSSLVPSMVIKFFTDNSLTRRVSSVVEHSSANPKVPGSILGPVSYREFWTLVSTIDGSTSPGLCGKTAMQDRK